MLKFFQSLFVRSEPLRVLTSLPRSGTHWLKGMIAEAMGIAPLEKRLRDANALKETLDHPLGKQLFYDHFDFGMHGAILNPKNHPHLRLVLLYRHPYDTLVSQFHVRSQKKLLPDMNLSVKDSLKAHLRQSKAVENFQDFIRQRVILWLESGWVYPVRYEDLVADTERSLEKVLDYLQIRRSPKMIQQAIAHNRFEVLSGGRARGAEDKKSHYRKGVAGDWKNYFDADDVALLKPYLGDYLTQLGYDDSLAPQNKPRDL